MEALSRAAGIGIEADPQQVEEPQEEQAQEEVSQEVTPEIEAEQQDVESVEEPEPERQLEPQDNAERSRLGREVKTLKDALGQQSKQIDLLMDMLQAQMQAQVQPQEEEEEFIPTTWRELDRRLEEREQTKAQLRMQQASLAQNQYTQGYVGAIQAIQAEEDDEELFNEASQLCLKRGEKFCAVVKGDGAVDAELNYAKAKAYVLKERLKAAKSEQPARVNPLKGKPPATPLGTGPSSKSSEPSKKLKQLSNDFLGLARDLKLNSADLERLGYEG